MISHEDENTGYGVRDRGQFDDRLNSHEGTKARRHEIRGEEEHGISRFFRALVTGIIETLFLAFPSRLEGLLKSQNNQNNFSFLLSFLRAFVPSCLRVRKKKLAILMAVAGLGTLAFAEDPLPKGWSPDLDGVTNHISDELKDARGQQMMNRLTKRLAEVRDAQLALIYLQLWQKLPAKEQAALKAEQAIWLKQRDRAAKYASDVDEGGSLAPYDYNDEFVKQTDLRIKELQERLKPRSEKPKK